MWRSACRTRIQSSCQARRRRCSPSGSASSASSLALQPRQTAAASSRTVTVRVARVGDYSMAAFLPLLARCSSMPHGHQPAAAISAASCCNEPSSQPLSSRHPHNAPPHPPHAWLFAQTGRARATRCQRPHRSSAAAPARPVAAAPRVSGMARRAGSRLRRRSRGAVSTGAGPMPHASQRASNRPRQHRQHRRLLHQLRRHRPLRRRRRQDLRLRRPRSHRSNLPAPSSPRLGLGAILTVLSTRIPSS